MKQMILLLVCSIFAMNTRAQEKDSLNSGNSNLEYQIKDQGDEVEIVTDEIVKKDKKDTTSFTFGSKEINIIEENGETNVNIKDLDDENTDSISDDQNDEEDYSYSENEDKETESESGKFKGHWSGFEFGPNNFVNSDFSLTRNSESEFLDLNTGKSWNYNFNFAQYSFPIISDRAGLVSGMGLEWSNYHFDNPTTIQKIDGRIQAVDLNIDPIKNRLQTTYLTIPLIAEVQLFKGERKERFYIAGGLIGGIKLFSNTKIKYNEDGTNQRKKDKNDYYLRPFRYALTGRIGYKMVKLYFNYYLTSLFIEDRGPEVYPVATGLAITF